ncbi:MAG: lycopene cyclase family protein [archaeon]
MSDIVIVGGGIAGLALGSQLSKKHKVVIIEKGKICNSHKPWTTEKSIATKFGLENYIAVSFKKSFVSSFSGKKIFINADLVTMDDLGVLDFYKKEIRKHGSIVHENCKLIGTRKKKDNIEITTSNGKINGRLLIDCSGVESKLAKDIYDREFYCPTYGGIYNYRIKDEEICLVKAAMRGPPAVFLSIYPMNKSQVVVYTDEYLTRKKNPLLLKKDHELNINNSHLKDKLKGKKMVREVYGIIPMGSMKKNSLDNIFFFGDSSLVGAPIVGSGFTNIILHSHAIADHLTEKLASKKLTEKDLEFKYNEKERMNRDLLMLLNVFLIYAKPDQIDSLFECLKLLGNKTLVDTLFMRLSAEQLYSILKIMTSTIGFKGLASVLPKKEFMFVAKETVKLIEETTVEEFMEIFEKNHLQS